MESIREILGAAFISFGLFFYVVGTAGLVRFPDVYMRIHSSGKVAMLGVVGLLAGAAFIMPEITLKAIALIVFMILVQPVASHAVASAAYRSRVPMHNPRRDDYARDLAKPREKEG